MNLTMRWLRHPTSHTAAVLALHSVSLFAVIALLARHAGAEALGHYVLGYAIGAPVFMFLNARQRLVLVNHTGEDDPTWPLVRTRLIAATTGGLTITAGAFAVWGASEPGKALVVSLVAATKAAEAISDIAYGGLQRASGLDVPLRSMARRAGLSLLGCAVVVPATGSAIAASATVLVVWGGAAALDLRKLAAVRPCRVSSDTLDAAKTLSRLWQTAVHPMAIAALLVSLAYYVPRYFLNATAGDAALGVFGALSYLGLVVQMLGHAVADSLLPGLTQRHRAQPASRAYLAAMHRLYWMLLSAGTLGVLLLLLLGDVLLGWILGEAFVGMAPLAALLLAAGALMAITSCQLHGMVALGLHSAQLVTALLAFSALLGAAALLIPRWGMAGAAVSDLIYAAVSVLLAETLLQWKVRKGSVPS